MGLLRRDARLLSDCVTCENCAIPKIVDHEERALRLSHERIYRRYEAEMETPVAYDALQAVLMDNLPLDEQRDLETRIEMSFWARSLRNASLSEIQHKESAYRRPFDRLHARAHLDAEVLSALGRMHRAGGTSDVAPA